ncbi:MAG: ATP phosphoribosyltransferase regulatory subunit, partial [Firmicutes bacterium]|nr:ATP phosphoribosyltransferase regulatory subunit [Bacillota bacterium]
MTTPVFEYFDLFNSGIGKIAQNEMYCLTDTTGNLIVLRPDSTKPIARLVATRLKSAKLPLRLFYNQSVYKRNIRLNRKTDEVMQFGGELIGINGIES